MFIFSEDGGIARLSLDRPAARNSIPVDGWSELSTAVARVAASDARALIVCSSTCEMFCAGADIKDMASLEADPALRSLFRQAMARSLTALKQLPIATIAAIDGGCFGAGVALALACDIRIAGKHAVFGITPAKLGILYPPSDVARLRALVGDGQAARLLFSGMTINGEPARQIGLVEEFVDDANAEALALAKVISSNSRTSVAGIKQILAGAEDGDQLFEDAFGGADFKEGLAAFTSRRKARFTN